MRTGLGQFNVGDTVYKYDTLAPIDGLRYGTQCAKVLGPALANILDVVTQWSADKMTIGDLATSVAPALATLDEDKVEGLMRTAFARVYTPRNECLGDEAAFNDWFSERQNEVFVVGVLAIYHLSKDFFPRLPATPITASQI